MTLNERTFSLIKWVVNSMDEELISSLEKVRETIDFPRPLTRLQDKALSESVKKKKEMGNLIKSKKLDKEIED